MPISPAGLSYFAYIFCSRKVENLLVFLSFVDIVFISTLVKMLKHGCRPFPNETTL
jgi:hypothetical protein